MTFTVFACETVTGNRVGILPGDIKSWSRQLNGGNDSIQLHIPVGALAGNRDTIRLYTEPKRMTLVLDWDGTPIVACPIQSRPLAEDGSVTIVAADIRTTILKWRKLITATPPFASQALSYANESLGSIAQQIVQLTTTGSAKAGASLPIVFQPLEPDSNATHQRTYHGYELKDVDGVLTDLTGVANGPDVDFTPQWVDATRQQFQWLMRTGTDEQPQLYSAAQLVFSFGLPLSAIESLTGAEDASKMRTWEWSLGSGNDVSTLMSLQQASSTLVNGGWPLLEGEDDDKSITLQGNLDSFASGVLGTYQTPTEQLGLKVNGALNPVLGSYLPGDIATVKVRNHPWLPDSNYKVRIVGMSGDNTQTLTLAVQ